MSGFSGIGFIVQGAAWVLASGFSDSNSAVCKKIASLYRVRIEGLGGGGLGCGAEGLAFRGVCIGARLFWKITRYAL